MNQPKVSVIIPVFNTEKYLRECLDSVVNQTLKDIEIICVDDGSTDGSLAILEEYREKDSRITVITQFNSGPSSARNRGMERAQGKYIDFLDSDDMLVRNTLETTFEIAEEENLDAILFEREPFYETEQLAKNPPVRYKHISEATGIMSGTEYIKASKDQGTYTVQTVIALWRRAFLEEHSITFQEGIIHEDNLFSFQAYMAADRVRRIPDIFYQRRFRENSIMTTPKSAKNVIGYFSCAVAVMKYGLGNTEPDKEQEIKREYTRLLREARRDYLAISDGEKEKLCFANELENELFKQLIKDRVWLEASNERLKQLDEKLKLDFDDKKKEVATLRHDLEKQKQQAENTQRDFDDKKKEVATLRHDLEKQKQQTENIQHNLDDKKKEAATLWHDLEKQKKLVNTLQYDLDNVHNSVSFRVGRAVTLLPRKVRGGVRCFQEHGAGYTVRRALYHMGLWKDEKEG